MGAQLDACPLRNTLRQRQATTEGSRPLGCYGQPVRGTHRRRTADTVAELFVKSIILFVMAKKLLTGTYYYTRVLENYNNTRLSHCLSQLEPNVFQNI